MATPVDFFPSPSKLLLNPQFFLLFLRLIHELELAHLTGASLLSKHVPSGPFGYHPTPVLLFGCAFALVLVHQLIF